MSKVSFKEMKKGTKKDYLLLDKHEKKFVKGTADRVLKFMSTLTKTLEGYQVSRLEHSLQTATRALKDGANDEMIVAALLHDIGDELAPLNHAEYAAAVLKPYVSENTHWRIANHGIFQMYMMQPVPTLRMFILSPPRIYMGQKKQLWLVMIIAVSYMLQLIFRMVLGIDYIMVV